MPTYRMDAASCRLPRRSLGAAEAGERDDVSAVLLFPVAVGFIIAGLVFTFKAVRGFSNEAVFWRNIALGIISLELANTIARFLP